MRTFFEIILEAMRPDAFSKANPSAERLIAMLEASVAKCLRGVVSENGDLFWWDAFYNTHDDAAAALGIENNGRLFMEGRRGQTVVYADRDQDMECLRRLASSPGCDRIDFLANLRSYTADQFIDYLDDD